MLSGWGGFGIALLVIFAEVEGWVVGLGLIHKAEVDQIFEILIIVGIFFKPKANILLRVSWKISKGNLVLVFVIVSGFDLRELLH